MTVQKIEYKFNEDSLRIQTEELIKGVSGSFKGEYYSPSFISSWNTCPAKTFFSSLIKEDFVAPLEIGSCVHTALESKFKNGEISPFLLEELRHNLNDKKEYISKMEDYISAYEQIGEVFSSNTEHYTELKIISEVSPLGVKLPQLKGFIDRLDISPTLLNIVDYKTSSREIPEDKYLDQLTIYKWLVEKEYETEVNNCYVCSLFPNNPRLIPQKITLCSQSRLIEKIMKTDEEVKQSIEKMEFKKCKSWQCKFCPCKDNCHFCNYGWLNHEYEEEKE